MVVKRMARKRADRTSLRVVQFHMVVKPDVTFYGRTNEFESSVISYGSKTQSPKNVLVTLFESSVISYGSKTNLTAIKETTKFESSVISYGSKT